MTTRTSISLPQQLLLSQASHDHLSYCHDSQQEWPINALKHFTNIEGFLKGEKGLKYVRVKVHLFAPPVSDHSRWGHAQCGWWRPEILGPRQHQLHHLSAHSQDDTNLPLLSTAVSILAQLHQSTVTTGKDGFWEDSILTISSTNPQLPQARMAFEKIVYLLSAPPIHSYHRQGWLLRR